MKRLCFVIVIIWCITVIYLLSNPDKKQSIQSKDDYFTQETEERKEVKNVTLDTIINTKNPFESLNIKYCGKPICKFLFAYVHSGQESEASVHFRTFTQLAEKLDRVMILVNVGGLRIGADKQFPFGFYYDIDGIQRMLPTAQLMTQGNFSNWLVERDRIAEDYLSAHVGGRAKMYLLKKYFELKIDHVDVIRECCKGPLIELSIDRFSNRETYSFARHNTGEIQGLDLEKLYFINKMNFYNFHLGYNKPQSTVANYLVKKLHSLKSDIIMIKHDIRKDVFPWNRPLFPYAEHIVKDAETIKSKLGKYVAVRWQMKSVDAESLQICADELIELLKKFKRDLDVRNVYLVTDYPLRGDRTSTSTLRKLKEYHHDAMNKLKSEFTLLNRTSLDVLRGVEKNEKEFKGAADINDIVDRLMCIKSDIFLYGSKNCAKRSGYTQMIVAQRKLVHRNMLDFTFGLPKKTGK